MSGRTIHREKVLNSDTIPAEAEIINTQAARTTSGPLFVWYVLPEESESQTNN